MYTYTLEHVKGAERPNVIRRPDGEVLFTCTSFDRRFAEEIVANLNMNVSLSPEDSDELLAKSA